MKNDLVIKYMSKAVSQDEFNSIEEADAKTIIQYEHDMFGEYPDYILEGDIVCFCCEWSILSSLEIINDYGYMGDTLEKIKVELESHTCTIECNSGLAIRAF